MLCRMDSSEKKTAPSLTYYVREWGFAVKGATQIERPRNPPNSPVVAESEARYRRFVLKKGEIPPIL